MEKCKILTLLFVIILVLISCGTPKSIVRNSESAWKISKNERDKILVGINSVCLNVKNLKKPAIDKHKAKQLPGHYKWANKNKSIINVVKRMVDRRNQLRDKFQAVYYFDEGIISKDNITTTKKQLVIKTRYDGRKR